MSIRPLSAAFALVAVLGAPLRSTPAPARNQPDRPVTVTVHLSTNYPIGAGADEATIQKQARAAFYQMAAGECALISQALKGDCALLQVNVNTRRMDPRTIGDQASAPAISAEGAMSFSVTPTATSSQ